MSCTVRSALHKKITESLRNTKNTTKLDITSKLSLKVDKTNEKYAFFLPLKLKQYNIGDQVHNITSKDLDATLDDIKIENDTILFQLNKENYIREVLQSNYETTLPPKYAIDSQNVIIEFSSPNIAKPFHMGHLRSTIIGNYIANLNKFLGNTIKRINYLGDWGTQYGYIQLGLKLANITDDELKSKPIRTLYDAYVAANKLSENDPSITEQAREVFHSLEIGKNDVHQNWETFREYTVEELRRIYSRIGVEFDEYHWESMYNAKNVQHIIEIMENTNLLTTDEENRKVICLSEENRIPIIKSDGSTLYITRDIAAALDRFEKTKFDLMYYVVDNAQFRHFSNLTEILKKMNMPWAERIKHIKFGRIQGMSTRKGTAIFLDDILNEMTDIMREKQVRSPTTKASLDLDDNSADILAVSAVIINDLKQKRQRDYTFDWNTVFNIKGDTGPMLQYCHCRLTSLEENSGAVLVNECDPTVFKEAEVHELISAIGKFDEAVLRSYEGLEPCILVVYLFQLSHTINKALKTLPVKGQPADVANQRLLLFHTAKNVLARGLKLLGITPLNKM